jgi:hypothetical protein
VTCGIAHQGSLPLVEERPIRARFETRELRGPLLGRRRRGSLGTEQRFLLAAERVGGEGARPARDPEALAPSQGRVVDVAAPLLVADLVAEGIISPVKSGSGFLGTGSDGMSLTNLGYESKVRRGR